MDDSHTFVAVDGEAWRDACAAAVPGDTILVPAGAGIIPFIGPTLPLRGVIVRATPPGSDELVRRATDPWRYGRRVAGENGMPARYR